MLPVLPQIAAASPPPAPAKPATSEDKGPSFSKVLDEQKNAPRQEAPGKAADAKPADAQPEQAQQSSSPDKSADAGKPADGTERPEDGSAADSTTSDAGTIAGAPTGVEVAATVQVQLAPTLPLQALEIAAQAAALQSQSAAKLAAQQTGEAVATVPAAAAPPQGQPVQAHTAPQTTVVVPGQAAASATAPTAQAAAPQAAAPQAAALPQQQAAVAAALPVAAQQLPNTQPVSAARPVTIATARDPRLATHATGAGEQAQAPLEAPVQAAAMPEITPQLPDFAGQSADSGRGSDTATQSALGALQASIRNTAAQPAPAGTEMRPAAALPLLEVATPVGAAQWGRDLGRQLVLLSGDAQRGQHTAELRLDPPDLGPLRVTLTLSDGVASASFVSSHAAVRQALESALPQLQQALAEAGISLGQANVGEQGNQFAQEQSTGQQGRGQTASGGDAKGDQGVSQPVVMVRDANALIDTFA